MAFGIEQTTNLIQAMYTIIIEDKKPFIINERIHVNPINDEVLWAYVETLPEVPEGKKIWLEKTKQTEHGNGRVIVTNITQADRDLKNRLERERVIENIDGETQAAIQAGFNYDGQRFSLSQNAQLNWQRLLLLHQNKLFGESQRISTKDNQTYVLKAANLQAFIRAGQSAIETALEAGRSRKQALHEG